jgi:hypothetical protein
MTITPHHTMTPLNNSDIIKDKTISWTIKSELLNNSEICEIIDFDIEQIHESRSDLVKYMRTYNKQNAPYKKYVFMLYYDRIFHITIIQQHDTTEQSHYYDDNTLEYAYDNR